VKLDMLYGADAEASGLPMLQQYAFAMCGTGIPSS